MSETYTWSFYDGLSLWKTEPVPESRDPTREEALTDQRVLEVREDEDGWLRLVFENGFELLVDANVLVHPVKQ